MSVAWITGGGSGIGRALAAALAVEGTSVVLSGRRAEPLEETVTAIRSTHPEAGDVRTFVCDVSRTESVANAAREIASQWGPITLLINNAGVNSYKDFERTPAVEFDALWQINCRGAIETTRCVLPAMRAARAGAIVNVSSILGCVASSDSAAYSISKFALTGVNEVMHQTLDGSGIHFMGVYPGYIRTAMTEPFVTPGSLKWRMGKTPEQMAQAILRGLKRRQRDVYFPWYVRGSIFMHQIFPGLLDGAAKRIRQRGQGARP